MKKLDELKNLVDNLHISEKRFVKILGKARSGGKGSQQLALFDKLAAKSGAVAAELSKDLSKNLPTTSLRLEQLISDSLRLLGADRSVDTQLTALYDQAFHYWSKGLEAMALKVLAKGRKLAGTYSRHAALVQILGLEREIRIFRRSKELPTHLEALKKDEGIAMQNLRDLQELQHLHGMMRSLTRQMITPRGPEAMAEIRSYREAPVVGRAMKSSNFLENALAVNIEGLYLLANRNPESALNLYQSLISQWQEHPTWVSDQARLFLWIVNAYISSLLYSPEVGEEVQRYLEIIPEIRTHVPEINVQFQRTLYQNQFNLALNTGNFDLTYSLIGTIEGWMEKESRHLREQNVLAFYHNFVVAEFLKGDFRSCYSHLLKILHLPGQKIRKDIRDFAKVMQVILQYELGNDSLNEYLARAGKRYFKSKGPYWEFESATFRFMEKALRSEGKEQLKTAFTQYSTRLEELAMDSTNGAGNKGIPILGITEMRIWVNSRISERPIREVFMEIVEANLKSMRKG